MYSNVVIFLLYRIYVIQLYLNLMIGLMSNNLFNKSKLKQINFQTR